jgi:hypothetical protein
LFFSRLPLLNARADPASRRAPRPVARASMYAAGTVATMVASLGISGYCWRRGARSFFVGANLWSVPLLLSESLRAGDVLRWAWRKLVR